VLASKSAEDRIADYTLLLTIVTGGLVVLGLIQAAQIRREFISTHRPRLRVRQVELYPSNGGHLNIVVANVGDSTARITSVMATDWDGTWNATPTMPPLSQTILMIEPRIDQRVLKTGEVTAMTYATDATLGERFAKRAQGRDIIPMMFLCSIRYRDDLGTERETQTFRWLGSLPPETRFVAVPDWPEHNYED
jgi:hypothetical protein